MAAVATETAELKMSGQRTTKNNKGYDMGKITYRFDDWVNSYDGKLPILDVGSGLGTNVLEALRRGCRVVAMDCAEEHLESIREEAGPEAVASKQLSTVFGTLPDGAEFGDAAASGILCAQVLHFLTPPGVKKTFQLFHRWLAPGGKLVVLACSNYVNFNLTSGVVRAMEAKIAEEGPDNPDSWPGLMTKESFAAQVALWSKELPEEHISALPGPDTSFMTFTHRQLAALATEAGFQVLDAELVPGRLSNYPHWLDVDPESLPEDLRVYLDKDMAVVVATKPATD